MGSSNIPPREGKAMAVTSLIICRVSETAVILVVVVADDEDEEADLFLVGAAYDESIDASLHRMSRCLLLQRIHQHQILPLHDE